MGRIGYSSVTLTDLTETIPVTLVLETSLPQNIQTKVGNLYTPDFSKNGEELIITPSLFRGKEGIYFKEHSEYLKPDGRTSGFLYYEIGSTIYKWEEGKTEGTYVDDEGRLHYNSNLTGNIMVEAYIEDFEDAIHSYTLDLVQATNPISILFLEEGNDNYFATIECEGGREHFEDTNANAILMTAKLYRGLDNLLAIRPDDFEIKWDRLSDGNTSADSTSSQLTVIRSEVTNRDLFTCEIKDKATGITYTAQQFIYDFTDQYNCVITYDKPLLLSEENTEVNLSAAVWHKNKRLEGETGYKLSYRWMVVGEKDGEDKNLSGNESTIKISSNDINIPQKQAFTVLCQVLHTDSAGSQYIIANGVVTFQWIPSYSVRISPKDIFVVTGSDGSYQGNANKQYIFNFQLVDKQGNLITFDTTDSSIESISTGTNSDGTTITFKQNTTNKWDFIGTITLSNALWNSTDGSRAYEFTYVYYGQQFTEEVNIIKNKTGAQGSQGFSGYTIDLSNEFHAFAGGEGQADADQDTSCKILAHYGDQKRDIEKITIGSTSGTIIYQKGGSIGEKMYTIPNSKGYLFISTAVGSNNNEVKVNIRTNKSTVDSEKDYFLTGIEPINFYITIAGQSSDLTFLKTFTYTINYNGKSYRLIPSHDYIKYSEAEGIYEPSEITVSATMRQESGEAVTYSGAKIIYSFDGDNWENYTDSGISGYANLQNIYLRLYSSQATFSSNPTSDISSNVKYLLDTETIPILTSLEGYQIGGENLLRWSKEMPVETNKWLQDGATTKEKDGEFGVFKLSSAASSIYAPMIPFKEEMINNQLTFSCYVKVADWSKFDGVTFVFCINENFVYNGTIRQTSGEVMLGGNNFIHPSVHGKASIERVNDKWCRFVWTFKVVDGSPENEGFFDYPKSGAISVDQAKYCTIGVIETGDDSGSGIQIKKMKLEYGNISTEWSTNPNDINYEEIIGTNLAVDSSFSFQVKTTDPYKVFAEGLTNNTYYTFSFKSSSFLKISSESENENLFLCQLMKGTNVIESYTFSNSITNTLTTKTFLTPDENAEYSFRIYAKNSTSANNLNEILTLEQAKIEKGMIATSFFVSDEYVQNLITALSSKSGENEKQIDVLTAEGAKLQTSLSDLQNTINSLNQTYLTINEAEGKIESISNKILTDLTGENAFLTQLQNKITIDVDDTGTDPYILIHSGTANQNFSTKISKNQLSFLENGSTVAYLSSNKLFINHSHFNESLEIDELLIKITDTGVGFVWS